MFNRGKRSVLKGGMTLGVLVIILAAVSTGEAAPMPLADAPKLWVTPLILDFGPVGLGATSATQTVTITNLGSATLTNFAGGGVYSPFGATQNCAGGVAPGASCQYFFTFAPTAAGDFSATSNTSTNAGSFSIQLRGKGVGAGLHVNPLALDFGSVYVNSTSPTQSVVIRNTGLSTLTDFAGGGVYPPFTASQNCAGGVAPGASCRYFFTFSPTTAGTFETSSNSSTNAGPFSIALGGRGRSMLLSSGQRVTPRSIDFGPVGVGYESGTQVVTLTNQSMLVSITDFAGGGVLPPFYASQNCAGGVAPGGNCQFYYTFEPTATGTTSTTSTVSNSAGSFTIELRGTGAGAELHVTPLALDFGPAPLFTTSATQRVTIRNTGLTTLTHFAGGGLYPPFSASQNCAGGVPPGGSCQYFFTFTPTAQGRFSAISTTSTNAGSFSIQVYGGEMLRVYLPLVLRQASTEK
ncbi:MAG: choice-of-anchor D domain-containing protein [Anaerolineae bacterium]|nr:choice-of-anchor D domain-containing protein [Anaerolineae bacterium]